MTTVELPYAPVDSLIREATPEVRVSSGAAEELASKIQERGATLAADAAESASEDGRKTIREKDFGFEADGVTKDGLVLPVAPIDRIARLRIEDYRVGKGARLALTAHLEEWAKGVAASSAELADHAGRRTVQREDLDAYFCVCGDR